MGETSKQYGALGVASGGLYRISAVSRWTGLTPATLRLWEDQHGLLHPQRSAGGMRLYSDSDVERALYIRQLVRQGDYSLEAIARILDESRLSLPRLMQDLAEAEHSGSAALAEVAAELRALVEDVHLREVTSRERIREGNVLKEVHSLVHRLVQADSFVKAGSTLVKGTRELTGAQSSSLGIYEPEIASLTFVLTARSDEVEHPGYRPWPLSDLPADWRAALLGAKPYYAHTLQVEELPPEVRPRVTRAGIASLYSHPLRVGIELVGTLVIASPKPDGITREAQAICEQIAVPASAAIRYFASRRVTAF